jgi:hypothetical protein
MKPNEDIWRGLYGESWKGLIHDDAFAHPAKFSRALIRRIYDHVIEQGWANKGDSVVDPFGGVALGAMDAMRLGLNWTGVELEMKFVGLGTLNILQWEDRFSRMPNWGTARLIQGDSRKLAEVLSTSTCGVSSPPYVLAGQDTTRVPPTLGHIYGDDEQERIARLSDHRYGETEGQLGTMKEGELGLAISSRPYAGGCSHTGGDDPKPDHIQGGDYHGIGLSVTSPPYANDTVNDRNGIDLSKIQKPGGHNSQSRKMSNHGETSGQLGAMKEGDLNLAVSSPPFPQPYTGGGGINVKGYSNEEQRKGSSEKPFDLVGKRTYQSKGGDRTEGNLETLEANGFDCAVSSPPFEGVVATQDPNFLTTGEQGKRIPSKSNLASYGESAENLGNNRGETFWSASRLIIEQLHQVIVPGGHAVFVVKAFVRDKKIVDFPGQWAQLCEAVGFRLLHHHRASLVEHSGTQGGFHEDKEIRVERKSFFRRLAEAKGSPRIDHESVLCFERAD